jgi:hypothetical protein
MRSYLSTFLTGLVLASSAAFGADKISFQGLDGVSSQEDVLRVFPHAKSDNGVCRAGQTTWKASDGEYSCTQLSLSNYIVDNRPYDLSFAFSVGGKLRFALLTRNFGGRFFENFSKADLRQQFDGLYKVLNYKYGDPLEEPRTLENITDCWLDNDDHGWSYRECAEWQTGPTQKFEPGQNHIVLKLSAQADPKDQTIRPDEFTGYFGDISITYKFADTKSAEQL